MKDRKAIGVISSDWHLSQSNCEQVKKIVKQKIDLCQELKAKTVICLGDVFEARKAQSLEVLIAFLEILQMFKEADLTLIAIPGNHDKVDYTSENSYLDPFDSHSNFLLIKDTKCIEVENLALHFIPFFSEDQIYGQYLKQIKVKEDKINILLTHIAVNGISNNDGRPVENELNKSLFKDFYSVLVGHYHNRSEIGKNIHYIGSIMPKNYGENAEKGFNILYEDGGGSFVNADFPIYSKINVNLDTLSKKEEELLLKNYSNSQDHIRFEITGDSSKIKSFDVNKFKSVGIDIKIKQKDIEEVIDLEQHNELIEYDKDSVLVEFDDFCVINEIPDKDKEIGLKYLNEILQ